ncbi:type II toxin-antitoxin system YafQ family toxin [Echinicola sediminis]
MTGYSIVPSSRFKKDYKKFLKRKKELQAIQEAIRLLAENGHKAIPQNMRPHKLLGNYVGYWECHVFPNLLIIWEQTEEPKEILLVRVGSHSDLF